MENNQSDHDLLIRVDTKLGNVIDELRLLRDGTEQRLVSVERGKVDKEEFLAYKVEHEKDNVRIMYTVNGDISALKRSVSRLVVYMAAIGGALAVLQFAIPLILRAWLGVGVA